MSHILVQASHIQRKLVSDTNTVGDGTHFVDNGLVAIETNTAIALILEQEDFDRYQHAAPRKLKIDLSMAGYQISFTKIYSSHYRHFGAAMRITGFFDCLEQEIITIKMSRDDARLVRQLLSRLGH